MGKLDKTFLMDASRTINVVKFCAKNKTEKISDDCSDSTTPLRVRFYFGDKSVYLFLVKGKYIDRRKFKDLPNNFKSSTASEVIMNPNTFMTDEAWIIIVVKYNVMCRNYFPCTRYVDEVPFLLLWDSNEDTTKTFL